MQSIWDWLLNLQQVRLAGGQYPRFAHPWPGWVAVLASVLTVMLVVRIYRRDGGTKVGRAVGATLRCLLLVLLLVLIWQPVIPLKETKVEHGVVAVLIDTSYSMATVDRYDVDDQAVQKAASANGDGPTSRPDGSADPELRRLADEFSKDSRLKLALDALDPARSQTLQSLLAKNTLVVYGFSDDAERKLEIARWPGEKVSAEVAERRLAELVEKAGSLKKLQANGLVTDLNKAVEDVLADLRGRKLAGMIVLSDGRSTVTVGNPGEKNAAKQASGPPRPPIHTVSVGSIHPLRDVSVTRVTAEPVVFVKDPVAVKVRIGHHGFREPEPVTVKLLDEKNGNELAPSQTVTVGGRPARDKGDGDSSREVEAEFRFQPDTPGTCRLVVRVEPPGGADLNPDNNASVTQVEVKDAKIKVLLIDGLPRWEYRFITHSLLREKTVTLSVMLLSADEYFAQEGSPGAAITRLPVTQDEWNRYDVILFGDVSPFDLTAEQMEQIEAFVRDRGGGFAMIAGEQFAPQRYVNTPIARLLPVEIDPMAGPDRVNRVSGFAMRLTHDGKRSPVLRFERQAERNEATINAFPLFYWYKPVLALKPGAEEVLAEHPTAVLSSGEPAPLLVCGRYGAGKTYFSAVDDTWRWRQHTGVPFFDAYWLQLIRHLSRNKLLATDRRFDLSTDKTKYELGRRVEVILQVLDKAQTDMPETVPATVTDRLNRSEKIELRRAGQRSSLYSAVYSPPGEGDYAFELDRRDIEDRFGPAPVGSEAAAMPRAQVHVEQARQETEDLSIDPTRFRNLAELTGYQIRQLAELGEVANSIPDAGLKIADKDRSVPLWNTRLALILFALIITAEWILRKKYNLQ